MDDSWDDCTPFQRACVKWFSYVRAHLCGMINDNWRATMDYAVLASMDEKYMPKVLEYYSRARVRMLAAMKGPCGRLIIDRKGFSAVCCRDMYDAIVFREAELNYDYERLFSSIRISSCGKGEIEATEHCPYCGASAEGIIPGKG